MPEPRISSQPVCLHTRHPSPPHIDAADIDFRARLGKREEARTQPDLRMLAEHFPHELQQRSFQIAHADILVDDQPFDLREHMGMRRIVIIAAVYIARTDDFDRNFALHASIVLTCTGEVCVRIKISSVI